MLLSRCGPFITCELLCLGVTHGHKCHEDTTILRLMVGKPYDVRWQPITIWIGDALGIARGYVEGVEVVQTISDLNFCFFILMMSKLCDPDA